MSVKQLVSNQSPDATLVNQDPSQMPLFTWHLKPSVEPEYLRPGYFVFTRLTETGVSGIQVPTVPEQMRSRTKYGQLDAAT